MLVWIRQSFLSSWINKKRKAIHLESSSIKLTKDQVLNSSSNIFAGHNTYHTLAKQKNEILFNIRRIFYR